MYGYGVDMSIHANLRSLNRRFPLLRETATSAPLVDPAWSGSLTQRIGCKAVRKITVRGSKIILARLCRPDRLDFHVPCVHAINSVWASPRQFERKCLRLGYVDEVVFARLGENISPTVVANRFERVKRRSFRHERFEERNSLGTFAAQHATFCPP